MQKSDKCHRKYGEAGMGGAGGDSSIKFVTKNVNCKGAPGTEVKKCRKRNRRSYTLTRNVT